MKSSLKTLFLWYYIIKQNAELELNKAKASSPDYGKKIERDRKEIEFQIFVSR